MAVKAGSYYSESRAGLGQTLQTIWFEYTLRIEIPPRIRSSKSSVRVPTHPTHPFFSKRLVVYEDPELCLGNPSNLDNARVVAHELGSQSSPNYPLPEAI